MEVEDLERLFSEKLESIKLQIFFLNTRMDNQVKTLQFLIGGIAFPLIILAIASVIQKF
jgi:hypothetical protein